MRGIGGAAGWLAAVVGLALGSLLLVPTQAAAQFNIEGIIRGAMSHGCCYGGGGYRRHSAPSHHARSHSKDDEAGENSDRNKEKDAREVESNAGGTQHQTPSGAARDASHSVESDAPARSSKADEAPSFSPAR